MTRTVLRSWIAFAFAASVAGCSSGIPAGESDADLGVAADQGPEIKEVGLDARADGPEVEDRLDVGNRELVHGDEAPEPGHDTWIVPPSVNYLVVTEDGLAEAAEELAAWRAKTGFLPWVVRVGELGNPAGGIGQAVQTLLAGLRTELGPDQPLHLVLVGDPPEPTGDATGRIPMLPYDGPHGSGFTDNLYGDLDGDQVPEVAVGRIPAKSPAQVRGFVEKLKRYETEFEPGPWNRRLILYTGQAYFGDSIEGLLQQIVMTAVVAMPGAFDVVGAYHNPVNPWYYKPFDDKVRDLFAGGSVMAVYMGHGSGSWTEGLDAEGVKKLHCRHRLPVAFLIACSAGRIAAATDSLAEQLLWRPDGPISVFAAGSTSWVYGNAILAYEAQRSILEKRPATLGEALLSLKRDTMDHWDDFRELAEAAGEIELLAEQITTDPEAAKRASRLEHLNLYNLVGDPGTRLRLPGSVDFDPPGGSIAEKRISVSGGAAEVGDGVAWVTLEVERDVIPDGLAAVDPADPDPAAVQQNWTRVSDRVIAAARVPVLGGRFRARLEWAQDLIPGQYYLRVYLADSGRDAVGRMSAPAKTVSPADLQPAPAADGSIPCPAGVGCGCVTNGDCESRLCAAGPDGEVCVEACQDGGDCPAGLACREPLPLAPNAVCLPRASDLCRPCRDDADCESDGARCEAWSGDGSFCTVTCGDGCPAGYACSARPDGGSRCLPSSGTCPCLLDFLIRGATTRCTVTNEFGTCTGERTCDQATCPLVPAREACNGRDDNCNGTTDEEPPGGSPEDCTPFAFDRDGDGYAADKAEWRCLCAPSAPWTGTQEGDCDDDDPLRNPGGQVCGRDGDCDGGLQDSGEECDDPADATCRDCRWPWIELGSPGEPCELLGPRGVVVFDDGRFVATWRESARLQDAALRVQAFQPDGTPVAPAATLAATNIYGPQAAVLGATGALVWTHWPEWLGPADVQLRTFGSDGLPRSEAVQLDAGMGYCRDPDVLARSDGFLVAWNCDHSSVWAQALAEDGAPNGSPSVVAMNRPSVMTRPMLVPVQDGSVVAVWMEGLTTTRYQLVSAVVVLGGGSASPVAVLAADIPWPWSGYNYIAAPYGQGYVVGLNGAWDQPWTRLLEFAPDGAATGLERTDYGHDRLALTAVAPGALLEAIRPRDRDMHLLVRKLGEALGASPPHAVIQDYSVEATLAPYPDGGFVIGWSTAGSARLRRYGPDWKVVAPR